MPDIVLHQMHRYSGAIGDMEQLLLGAWALSYLGSHA